MVGLPKFLPRLPFGKKEKSEEQRGDEFEYRKFAEKRELQLSRVLFLSTSFSYGRRSTHFHRISASAKPLPKRIQRAFYQSPLVGLHF
jgi:hypothetical protein